MTLKEIKQAYLANPKTISIAGYLKSGNGKNLHVRGALGSSLSFIISSVFQKSDCTFLIIMNDREEAAYLLNDLENLLGEGAVLFFPASYRKPYQPEAVDNANILSRAELLNKLNVSKKQHILVSYPEALNEKVVTKNHLKQNTLEIKAGEKLSLDFISEVLFEYEFERVDYVTEPGQFSIRGGIVDVFSFSNDHPYRIEFSGNDIESIRSFDPVSQLSVMKMAHINIIPNVQEKLLRESRESFFDFIPGNTIVCIKDVEILAGSIENQFEIAKKAFEENVSTIRQLSPGELYIDRQQLEEKIRKFCLIELGSKSFFPVEHKIEFNITPQPSFNKNFELLIRDLESKAKEGYENLIFADTVKQLERIDAIFKDISIKGKVNRPGNEARENTLHAPVLLSLHEGFIDHELKLVCYTDHQVFDRYHRFRLKNSFNKKKEAITIKELYALSPGDFVTHIDHGVGRFAGLEKINVNGKMQEAIRLVYRDNDILYVSIHSLHRISKFSSSEGTVPKINKLGSNAWSNLKQKTKAKVKDIAKDLIDLYAKRRSQKGFQYAPDTYLQNELEASFIYEDTPDQLKATVDVKKDMQSSFPMDRLICGDVGFGKTEIAIRAAFKAVTDGKQVAVLVPTTILALQHYKTFKERLKDFPCTVDYISRFKTAKEQKETLAKVEKGEIDILIGTHRIVSKDVKFKQLGLLIIDEEQKFGVAVKEKLKSIKINVDTLTLTATPIPRTLQFSMMGARDLSIINTPPPNRFPVETELQVFNEENIRDAISFEVNRGGQVFFVHNRIQNIGEIAEIVWRLCPGVKTAVAHGQMEAHKLEDTMRSFIEGEYDVLIATTIIESGLDIPNANTIIINNAHMFGLSDLHQMRGRVGRSNKKAFCYLFSPPILGLTQEARRRLEVIEQFSELGSGFNVAMRDLDIRGAGNLLGGEQSGFIAEIGFEMYQKILDEAIQELKENEYKELFKDEQHQIHYSNREGFVSTEKTFVKDCQVETDLEILIPDEYVSNITERLSLYKELDDSEQEEELVKFEASLLDRFGPIPNQVKELINAIRLRWIAKNLGLEKIVLKRNTLVGYFIANQQSAFYQSPVFSEILAFVQSHSKSCKMKETNNKLSLTFENVKNIEVAIEVLNKILKKEEAKV